MAPSKFAYVSHMSAIQTRMGSVERNKTTVRNAQVGPYGRRPRQVTGSFVCSSTCSFIRSRFIKHPPQARKGVTILCNVAVTVQSTGN